MGKKLIRQRFLLTLLLAVLIPVVALSVNARTSIEDLEQQKKETEQAIEDAKEEFAQKNAGIAERSYQILELEEETNRINNAIAKTNSEIATKEEEIGLTLEQLDLIREEQDVYYEQTKERIKVMYEFGSTEYLEVLLESKDTSDFFNRLEYLNKLVAYDQEMLEKIQEIEEEIKRHENQLTVEKIELEELQAENMVQKNDVEALRVKKEKEIVSIQEDKELILQEIQMMEKEQEERDKMIEELIKLYADSTILFGGDLDWPVPGWSRISSEFGPRIHPVHGYRSTHTGIDIPASYGTSVKAAGSGRVIFAGWGTAYGNFILIDHGVDPQKRHVVTQYAHNSELLVSEGDVVVRGETIAKVGSTGWSTGNHLHFGVQIGGEWVDPMKKASAN
ncbi:peptidoglycan DD-metalloendopeptidase family protein [Vallitaleaceae bacterium 9-2]